MSTPDRGQYTEACTECGQGVGQRCKSLKPPFNLMQRRHGSRVAAELLNVKPKESKS